MWFLGLIALGVVVGTPIAAIVALIRAGDARRLANEALEISSNRISDLRGELADLRRELRRATERLDAAGAAAGSAKTADAQAVPAQAAKPEAPEQPASLPRPATAPSAQATLRPIPHAAPSIAPAPARPISYTPAPAAPVQPPVPKPTETKPPEQPAATLPVDRPAATRPVAEPVPASARVETPVSAAPRFTSYPPEPPRVSWAERLRKTLPLEEVLGMNLFAKIGIVLLVLGFALLGRVALLQMGPGARVALIYAVGAVMLVGGIRLEKKDRYRLVGRTGIGGGWALLFFTTYALYHVAAMSVLSSNTLDCVLMLAVAAGMVAHTLGYKSQLVTGLAFLLAFSTVALSQDSVYALVAGVILAVGIVAIALKMGWYELEVFGILASFGNHFYWLYRLYPDGVAGHAFKEFWPSTAILIAYWAIFRVSYVVRRINAPGDERMSTVAALANTMLLGAVMKFQSTRPELAFYALLGIGAAEFIFAQLTITRRRRAAFVLLTVMGTLLMFAAVPFRYSGNNIALFWMIGSEALLIAGIAQAEVLFRRLGLIAGGLTGLLVVYEARGILELRQTSEAPLIKDGVLLLTSSLLFYLNSHFIAPRWRKLFEGWDGRLALAESYIGCATAFLGVWAIFTGDATALGWAALVIAAAVATRYLNNKHFLVQGALLAAAVMVRASMWNSHWWQAYPQHVTGRLVTLPILAAVFYLAAWLLSGVDDERRAVRSGMLWAGSALLASLAWLDLAPAWIGLAWIGFAVALALAGRRLKVAEFNYQEHALAVMGVAQLVSTNIYAAGAMERYLPLAGSAALLYAVSRFSTQAEAGYRRPAAWMHTCTATALLAALAWHESSGIWLAAIWAGFALALAVIDRIFDVEELPYQAHALAVMSVASAAAVDLFTQEKWHGVDVRLIAVSLVAAVLYALARWVRMPAGIANSGARHVYTWVASGLAAWMLWSELQPISVALGIAVFGLLLFEVGAWRQQKQLRLQGYALLAASFPRIFFVNLTAATLPGEALSPRIYTVAPLALIYFFVWAQLEWDRAKTTEGRGPVSALIAYLGTGSVAALLYYQTSPEWIVVAWAVLALALLAASLLADKQVFLEQANLLTAGIVGRGLAHNIYGASYFGSGGWKGNFAVLSMACALLLAGLPIAFRLRARGAERPAPGFVGKWLAVRWPEQVFFFAPVLLTSFMIAVKMNPGMVTLAWGMEGVVVILLGLLLNQRSYRLTGLTLMMLCVGKIVFLDAWRLDERDRYITFIALGAALTLVSTLYSRYRDALRRLL